MSAPSRHDRCRDRRGGGEFRVRTLFDGEVHVHYSQLYVESDPDEFGVDLAEAFTGQANGLCGAAAPGNLFLITGLHTGNVGFTVQAHDDPPPVDESWEEIVEVSFTPASPRILLMQWAGERYWELELDETDYRVRYCASGMAAAKEADTRMEEEPRLDRYLLQFWPSAPESDRVVKQTSEIAAYWHGFARDLPPRVELPPPTPEEIAEREHRARDEAEDQRLRLLERQWGGRLPNERLRTVGGPARSLAELDRALIDAISEADPETQRAIAKWVVRRAYRVAGLAGLDWVAPALLALEEDRDLPAPFDDTRGVWDRFFGEERMPRTTVDRLGGGERNVSQQAMALPSLWGATEADPLHAVLNALHAAAAVYGSDHPELFAELRTEFPVLPEPSAS
jgi:hypothetical protein